MAVADVPFVVRSVDEFWHLPDPPPGADGWLVYHDDEPVAFVPKGSPMIGDGLCTN
jgi:hypothetical protein